MNMGRFTESTVDTGATLRMDSATSSVPDILLRLTQTLPPPLGIRSFYQLRRVFRFWGRKTGVLTRIRFKDIEITAPLDHPSVYWRYQPVGFNQNYVAVARHVLKRRNGLIIDVGANIGDGIALLRGEGIVAPILGVEGAENWFDLLSLNVRVLSAVTVERVFLGAGKEETHLCLYVHDGTSKLVSGDSGVELTSLDHLMLRHDQYPVVLLKTDTDGFDAKVLFGAESLLKAQHPVVFAEVDEGLLNEQGNTSKELLAYLSDCGYSYITAWDNFGTWLDSRPISTGLSDLIARYPGGPETPYLDVAVASSIDDLYVSPECQKILR